jgi:hypothetical protein
MTDEQRQQQTLDFGDEFVAVEDKPVVTNNSLPDILGERMNMQQIKEFYVDAPRPESLVVGKGTTTADMQAAVTKIKKKKGGKADGVQKTVTTEAIEVSETVSPSADPGESEDESANPVPVQKLGFKAGEIRPDGWHVNIIGEPGKAHPNPYFQGLISTDGYYGAPVYIPFKEIKWLNQTVYYEDIHVANPVQIGKTMYRVSGAFREVVVRVSEAEWEALLIHPEVKIDKKGPSFNYVSDHVFPRRVYTTRSRDPLTPVELEAQDKEEDRIQLIKSGGDRSERKAKPAVVAVVKDDADLTADDLFTNENRAHANYDEADEDRKDEDDRLADQLADQLSQKDRNSIDNIE